VTKNTGEIDEEISRVELNDQVNAGIRWRSIATDMVPIFEEQTVRLERGYTIERWYALDEMERAIMIAQKRIENISKGHQNEAEQEHAKQQARRNSGKRKR